ncbi:MAG: excinuclease ABC subunit UvrA [Bacteroidales bacterium]|jgi:excinuclease ABC subunit A|nr:excinuclease ABC subunit UvrA [Bacteroidales bacterium]
MEKQLPEKIILKGVRVNNLKNINVEIPHGKLIVITGLSGSGKSSLAFETLFAEGQRRYVESLSSYARQFLGRMNKPEVDFIEGIPPAIAIQQKVNTKNPRSTVGTTTEIYDYLKLLFARIGKTYSPISGNEVKKHSVTDVIDYILQKDNETKILICFKRNIRFPKSLLTELHNLQSQGYTRIVLNNEIVSIDKFLEEHKQDLVNLNILVILDRIVVRKEDPQKARIADSVQTAIFEGFGECTIVEYSEKIIREQDFSTRFEADNIKFENVTPNTFSFNNPIGACPTCEGFGQILGFDEDLVIPNKNLSVFENAIACWRGEMMQEYKKNFIITASLFDFPIHRPYFQLNNEEKKLLWYGKKDVKGIYDFFEDLETQKHKIQFRILLARFRGKTICPTCNGKRLKPEAEYVKINNKSITDLVDISITDLFSFFKNIELNEYEQKVAKRILTEIQTRLKSVIDVGLHYLTLNRLSSSLSGGESQRINLATLIGSGLVGSLYVFDEPSIGLHPQDTGKLIKVLKKLRDNDNTIVVVEHDEEIMREADYIIDIGPKAGEYGGEIVFAGELHDLLKCENSLTAKYLRKELSNEIPRFKSLWNNSINIIGARLNNLKNIDVKIPLGQITVITGVSGSGKTSLIKGILYPAIKAKLNMGVEKIGDHTEINGDIKMISDIEYIDQNPIGKSSRSNPATYIKVFDDIRKLFSEQKQAKMNGYTAGNFSFNSAGGRCEMCQGEGEISVEMQFMADVHLVCEACHGKRFKDEILEVKYRDKNIFDILEMSVSEAVEFFRQGNSTTEKKITNLLQYYLEVGLGYVKLGQSSSTLSGGESQRIKLASFLSKEKSSQEIFVFDEPTTGLHFYDISNLLKSLMKLKKLGHTIIIIEHNPEIIKNADWILDLGPEGGENGGNLVFAGTPEELVKDGRSKIAKYL